MELFDVEPEVIRALGDQFARFGKWAFVLILAIIVAWTVRGVCRRKG